MPLVPVNISSLTAGNPTVDYMLVTEDTAGNELMITAGQLVAMYSLPANVMTTDIYDPDGDGIVSDAAQLNSQPPSYYLDRTNHTGLDEIADVNGLQAALDAKVDDSEKAAPLGVATLDANGKLLSSQMPLFVGTYVGVWDANTNTPALSDATGTFQDAYIVSVAGSQDLGSGVVAYVVGNILIHNGTIWEKVNTTVPATGVTDITTQTLAAAIGSITIDDTSHFNDVAGKRFMIENWFDAATAAAAPAAGNAFATMNDIATVAVTGTYPPSPNDVPDPTVAPRHATTTFADVGITQPQIDAAYSMYAPGTFVTTDTIDFAAMQHRVNESCNNGTPMCLVGNYFMGSKNIVMPKQFTQDKFTMFGFGNNITFAGGMGWTRTKPVNLGESQQQQNCHFTMKNVRFYGSGAGIGFEPAANTGSYFEDVYFQDFATAAVCRTMQGAIWDKLKINSCYDGIYIRTNEDAPGWGASLSQVQSNGTRLYNPAYWSGVTGGVAISYLGSYGGQVVGAQIEGNDDMDYAISCDGQGITTVQDFEVVNPHFENVLGYRSAAIYCRLRSGVGKFIRPEHDISGATAGGAGNALIMLEAVSDLSPSPSTIIHVDGLSKWAASIGGPSPGIIFNNTDCRWLFSCNSAVVLNPSIFSGTAVSEVGGNTTVSDALSNEYQII